MAVRQIWINGEEKLDQFEFIVPCHFGLESVMKKEITDLGYPVVKVEDGRVTFSGDAGAISRANVFLRTTERVLLKAGSFRGTASGGGGT